MNSVAVPNHMLKLLLIPLLLYLAILLLVFALQTRILFPVGSVGAAGPLPPGAERLELDTPAGHRLRGIRIPPSSPRAGPGTLILGFGGNAWNAEHAAAYLHDLYPQADVVAFHYRGYAPSAGEPGAEALVEDAPLVHDLAVARVKPALTVAVGFSVGSGVAAGLAARRPLAGLILVTPFDSLAEVAAGHYPWLPVRFLFRHRLDSAAALGGTSVPTAIVAAERDALIPARRTDALRRAVPNLVFDRTIAGANHNDIYDRPVFHQAMREALARGDRLTIKSGTVTDFALLALRTSTEIGYCPGFRGRPERRASSGRAVAAASRARKTGPPSG